LVAVGAAAIAAIAMGSPAAVAAPAAPGRTHSTIGAPGVGDPFFPDAGNGGYDVRHYDLAVDYTPATRQLAGRATIAAAATQVLTRFDLDLRSALRVSRVTVNGLPARFAQQGAQELVISPRLPLLPRLPFLVTIDYAGVPQTVIDPDESLDGWIPTDDGVFVASEPQGAASWFPGNDHPSDKATFTTHVTVPDGVSVLGNGRLVRQTSSGGRTTFVWDERFPMTTYLATVTMGNFQITQGRTASGIPTYVAVDPHEAARANPVLAKLPDIVEYEQQLLGPYPFEDVGAIVDNARFVGYALETQTKPVFDRAPSESTLAHELAHQWFGDSVSLTSFPQMWLNEGFATYVQQLWTEHAGGPTAQQDFDRAYATPASVTDFWNPPSAAIGEPDLLFTTSVYARGAMALHALRVKIGDPAFFRLLRSWAALHRYGNGTIAQFTALAHRISHQDLRDFFQVWLFTPGKPTSW